MTSKHSNHISISMPASDSITAPTSIKHQRWQSTSVVEKESLKRKLNLSTSRSSSIGNKLVGGRLDKVVSLFRNTWKLLGLEETNSSLTSTNEESSSNSSSIKLNTRHYPGMSKFSNLVVCLLLLLGLREVLKSHSPTSLSPTAVRQSKIKLAGRDPFKILQDFAPIIRKNPKSFTTSTVNAWESEYEDFVRRDTTAIVLHWKRTENVVIIAANLCRYAFFKEVVIWNNNPEVQLDQALFESAKCPPGKLRIYNSPSNLYFTARYLACAQASTPSCFFQDDDWLVLPLQALHSQFSRDPEGPVVLHTNPEVAMLFGLEWCFFQSTLHTCFSWVGTGAFVSQTKVKSFLSLISQLGYPRGELSHADNSFTTFLNEAPYVLSGELAQLPQPFGHSDGEGIERNKGYIYKGIQRLSNYLDFNPSTTTLLSNPLPVPIYQYKIPITPLSSSSSSSSSTPETKRSPHPYTHHARSPCYSDSCLFITNIPILPPPDAIPFPGTTSSSSSASSVVGEEAGEKKGIKNLGEWENYLGWIARGWKEGTEIYPEEEDWGVKWGYSRAVDGDSGTAFRSLDVVIQGDYIALGLVSALNPRGKPKATFVFILEEVNKMLPGLSIEVSRDGYHWVPPQNEPLSTNLPLLTDCTSTSHYSTSPDLSFPTTFFTSPSSTLIQVQELLMYSSSNPLSSWWNRRRRRSRNLLECRIELSSVFEDLEGRRREESDSSQEEETREDGNGKGWKFVRLVAKKNEISLGWGVYELWLE